MKLIFSDFWIEISMENGNFFLNYDEGELVPKFRTIEISREEAEKAKLSPKDAYEVIIAFQNKELKEKRQVETDRDNS